MKAALLSMGYTMMVGICLLSINMSSVSSMTSLSPSTMCAFATTPTRKYCGGHISSKSLSTRSMHTGFTAITYPYAITPLLLAAKSDSISNNKEALLKEGRLVEFISSNKQITLGAIVGKTGRRILNYSPRRDGLHPFLSVI